MCIFCEIVNGKIPCYKIYEDEYSIAFLDLAQNNIGHTLVVPKKHVENIFSLDEDLAKELFSATTTVAKKLKNALNINNINIVNNNGVLAGQEVNHFHIHLIPREENDGISFTFKNHKLTPEEFVSLMNKINQS